MDSEDEDGQEEEGGDEGDVDSDDELLAGLDADPEVIFDAARQQSFCFLCGLCGLVAVSLLSCVLVLVLALAFADVAVGSGRYVH